MPKSNKKLTPAMAQYARMKDQYPDAILFFRMGDFYETFNEDAKIASKVLGLTGEEPRRPEQNPPGWRALSRR